MNDIELINGRECSKLVLSNGDTIYSLTKLKGGEYRKLKTLALNAWDIEDNKEDQVNIPLNPNDEVQSPKSKFNKIKYVENMFIIFPILCKVKRAGNENIEDATMEYFDNLDLEDADLIFNKALSPATSDVKEKKTLD